MNALSRRGLLQAGGALLVAFSTRPASAQHAATKMPGSLDVEPHLSGWVRIAPDGAVTTMLAWPAASAVATSTAVGSAS